MSSSHHLPSVSDFVKTQTLQENDTLALGNPAGDADSIISAIAVAYIDSTLKERPTVPIISIPHQDLKTQRPETKYLLELAGIDLDDLIAIDHQDLPLPSQASVTLVDHNQLTLDQKQWTVTHILDHHIDEGAHTDTCHGETSRNIAFDSTSSKALVASTCTLMVERFLSQTSVQQIPASLSILLLGVILLDSINMSPKAGKGSERDALAIQTLQTKTDWKALNLPKEIQEGDLPNPTRLFETLQNQKFHPDFWNSLTSLQALKLDYKSFGVPNNNNQPPNYFGVSSVLQSMADFWNKTNILPAIRDNYSDLDFFGIMFFSVVDETPQRQISLICKNLDFLDSLEAFLQQEGSLKLQIVSRRHDEATDLHVIDLNQGNAIASRKQVVPVLMEYFKRDAKL